MAKTIKSISFDARKEKRAKSKSKFKASTAAEKEFYRSLKKVAQATGHIIDRHTDGAMVIDPRAMTKALQDYSEKIGPWATKQSAKLLEKVSKSNKRAYKNQSQAMGQILRNELAETHEFGVGMALLNEQVELIKSIPIEAGLRAQRIAAENFFNGTRATPDAEVVAQLQEEMGMSTQVAVNRAKLIARTETARANAAFVQSRAISVGVQGYIWRTTMDGAERHAHAQMDGKYVAYDKPPRLSDGTVGHAGTFPNCRCWQDPVLPED